MLVATRNHGTESDDPARGARKAAWLAAIAGVLGVWAQRAWDPDPVLMLALACAALALAWVALNRVRSAALLVAVAALMGAHAAGTSSPELGWANELNRGDVVEFRGGVTDIALAAPPTHEPWDPPHWSGGDRTTLRVRLDAVRFSDGSWNSVRGGARVLVLGEHTPPGIGHAAVFKGTFSPISGPTNPGEPDWARLARTRGDIGTLVVPDPSLIEDLGATGIVGALKSARASLRSRAFRSLVGEDPDPADDVLAALLLGERTNASFETRSAFARVGVAHALAVSGLHVGIVLGVGVLVVRLTGDRPRAEAFVVCALVLLIWVMVPIRVPIARALVIFGVLALARTLGRRIDPMTALGWTALGLLVWRPTEAFSLGYQLSVLITALLITMGRPMESRRLELDAPRRGALGWFSGALRFNAGCWALATPIVMVHTGVVSFVGAVASVPAAFVAGGVMLAGAAQLALDLVTPGVFGFGEDLAHLAAGAVLWIDAQPWSSTRGVNPGPVVGPVWGAAATAVLWVVLTRWRVWRRRGRVFGVCAVMTMGAWAIGVHALRSDIDGVRVDMLDVEDGSMILVRSGRGAMLYDAGSLDGRQSRTLERATHELGARRVRDVVVSHDNLDHFNALPGAARTLGVERVYVSASMDKGASAAWEAVESELLGLGVEVRVLDVGDTLTLGDATVACVRAPDEDPGRGVSLNDRSLVLVVTLRDAPGAGRVVLTGDSGPLALASLMEVPLGDVKILEAPHHGSYNGVAESFIELFDPDVVLQSTGETRSNDPRWSASSLDRVWRDTHTHGWVWAQLRPDGSVEHGGYRE